MKKVYSFYFLLMSGICILFNVHGMDKLLVLNGESNDFYTQLFHTSFLYATHHYCQHCEYIDEGISSERNSYKSLIARVACLPHALQHECLSYLLHQEALDVFVRMPIGRALLRFSQYEVGGQCYYIDGGRCFNDGGINDCSRLVVSSDCQDNSIANINSRSALFLLNEQERKTLSELNRNAYYSRNELQLVANVIKNAHYSGPCHINYQFHVNLFHPQLYVEMMRDVTCADVSFFKLSWKLPWISWPRIIVLVSRLFVQGGIGHLVNASLQNKGWLLSTLGRTAFSWTFIPACVLHIGQKEGTFKDWKISTGIGMLFAAVAYLWPCTLNVDPFFVICGLGTGLHFIASLFSQLSVKKDTITNSCAIPELLKRRDIVIFKNLPCHLDPMDPLICWLERKCIQVVNFFLNNL